MIENQNAALWFVDRHVEEGRSAKVAFREADRLKRSLTYGALAKETSVFAGALDRHEVRREERVAMIMLDQIEFPTVFWGAMKAGAIPVPMNTLLSSPVYEAMLNDSRATILFVSDELWPVVAPAVVGSKFLRSIVVVGEAAENTINYAAFIDGANPIDTVEATEDELAFWLYSSGSTGLPKGVRHIHSSMRATAENFGQEVLGIREDDIVYSVAKFFFAYGLGNAMSFPLSVGATTILLGGRATPPVVFALFEKYMPTIFCGVPTLFAALIAAKDTIGGAIDAPLRMCTSAGEALPRAVGECWSEIWGVDIIDGVGSTEMLHIFLSNRPDDIVYGSSGVPVPGYEVRLVDENDEEVADGAVGELLVRGPSSAEGYWNRRDKTQDTFQGHWTRSGDKYERTSGGRYVYCGRTDDMFKVSGIWVSPFEVEQALVEHPSVLEAAVVAWADENGLEKPKAFIVLNDGADASKADDLKDFVKEQIGMWKYPRWIDVVDDLPKTATGKIQRFKLRQGE